MVIAENDVLLAVGPSKVALERGEQGIGEDGPRSYDQGPQHLDYLRVFASRPAVVGRALGDLDMPGDKAAFVLHVRRGDTDLHVAAGPGS